MVYSSRTTRISSLFLSVILMALGHQSVRADNGDYLGYPIDSTVKIFINWDTFEQEGIPSSWRRPFTDSVINAYTRWVQVGGVRLNPKFWGYTERMSPEQGEILIRMNESHNGRIASRFGRPALIVFHRNNGNTGTPWDFVPWRARRLGEIDMQGILMHELGHAFGLEHESDVNAVMYGGAQWFDRYGPFSNDIEDIRRQYGAKTNRRFTVKRSVDGGGSWADVDSNLGRLAVTTSMAPTVSRDPARSILFYTHYNKQPAWIIGNNGGSSFDTQRWWVFGGLRSAYGNAGHGFSDEYMMAWVDDLDEHRIKVARSNDGGIGWAGVAAPAGARSYGTPAIHKISANTWILAYSKFDKSNIEENGKIVAHVSTDDGRSWSEGKVLNRFYRAESGVSLSSQGSNEVRLGFSWARGTTAANYLKRTIVAYLDGGELVYDRMIYESESTRTQPVMAKGSLDFIQAWRETNSATSINTRISEIGSDRWDNYVRVVNSSPVTPALAAYRNWSYAFLYALTE